MQPVSLLRVPEVEGSPSRALQSPDLHLVASAARGLPPPRSQLIIFPPRASSFFSLAPKSTQQLVRGVQTSGRHSCAVPKRLFLKKGWNKLNQSKFLAFLVSLHKGCCSPVLRGR